MKGKFFTLLFFTILSFVIFSKIRIKTKIENLKTDKEVENFIKSFHKKKYAKFKIFKFKEYKGEGEICKKIADSLNITKSFYKADFDNNGLTDILVIGKYYGLNIFVVMDFGENNLKLYNLKKNYFPYCIVPKISKIGNKTVINYYYEKEHSWLNLKKKFEIIKKTWVYKFGDFVEYNYNPKEYNIEKIEYETTPCFGFCSVFTIKIDQSKNAIFNAKMYNRKGRKGKEIKGIFQTKIKENDYSKIVQLLNYIDFPNLKDNYSVGWTCDQSCILTVTYNNGKVKKINDYGLKGTSGLINLYGLMFNLRFNQDWKKKQSEQ